MFRFPFRKRKEPAPDGAPKLTEKRFGNEENGFLYVTKGKSTPRGKAKVFLTGHPEDLALFRGEIIQDILSMQNCVVCYRDPDRQYTDGESDALMEGAFELFVFAVTRRLLTGSCPAIDHDLPYAVQHHIPILPLMLEENLDSEFTARFGDLQYLSKNVFDPTALRYSEKLKSYLARVLTDDSETRRIRDAFDAWIFLSYRKKDRRHANELRRLVHGNSAWRDVAIWYDEYLIPGENYNDEIAGMMRKSDAMLLAVTPNIVNEENYVHTVEYPMALGQKKAILPAEIDPLTPQERASLREQYDKLPVCFDPRRSGEMAARLAGVLGDIARRKVKNDPVHVFFIGLAYLKGIDVETDSEKAVELITEAAQQDLPEAMNRLREMYTLADGIERDIPAAQAWQERLIGLYRRQYESQPDERGAERLCGAMNDLYRLYTEYGPRDKAAPLCDEILAFAEKHSGPWSAHTQAECLMNKGYAAYQARDIVSAQEFYGRALPLLDDPFDRSVLYEHMSLMLKNTGRTKEAREYITKALDIRQKLASPDSGAEKRGALAQALLLCGDLEKELGDPEKAAPYYREALKRSRDLADETGSVWDLDRLGVCLCAMAEITSGPRKKEYYQKALDVLGPLADSTGMPFIRGQKLICQLNLKDGTPAEKAEAVRHETGRAEPDERSFDADETERSATDAEARGDYGAAREALDRLYRYMRGQTTGGKSGDADFVCSLYVTALRLARSLIECGETAKARQLLEKTREDIAADEAAIHLRFTAKLPGHPLRSVHAGVLLLLARCCEGSEALKYFDRCPESLEAQYRQTRDPDVKKELAAVYRMAAELPGNPDADLYLEEASKYGDQP